MLDAISACAHHLAALTNLGRWISSLKPPFQETSKSASALDPTPHVPFGEEFRPDIEGLRAVAILLVLLFHAGVAGFSGGFVGVDIFYVISGFLITSLILRELRATRTVALAAFYARRARRLLPAAALVLLVTVVVSALVLPPLRLPDVAVDAAWAALYVSNLRFALQATDYLQADSAPSPILHFWSLGVEEQFYFFWPALLLFVFSSRNGGLRRVMPAIALIGGASLALAIWMTGVSVPWAFFSLPTRTWELAIGALIAAGAARLALMPAVAAALAGWTGLAMVILSARMLDGATPYPGTAAILPVAGTGLVLLAGLRRPASIPSRLLAIGPMRFMGRISYSLYLWHWPMIVLPAAALETELPLGVRVALAAATIPVAAASQRWVEDPIRHGRLVGLQPSRAFALVGVLTVTVTLASLGIGRWLGPADPSVADRGVLDRANRSDGEALPDDPGFLPGDALVPIPAAALSVAALSDPAVAPAWGGPLPADLRPSLAQAKNDRPAVYTSGCHLDFEETEPRLCAFGRPASSTTVALFGDSHAAQWFPALESLARFKGWRLLSFTKSACASADATIYNRGLKRAYTECDAWRERVFARIERERPDLVILANSRTHLLSVDGAAVSSADREDLWAAALARTLDRIRRSAGMAAIIGDTPRAKKDAPTCLSRHPDNTLACATSRILAVAETRLESEREVAVKGSATFIDPTPWLCSVETCPVVIGRYLVLRDGHHLTTPFASALARRLSSVLPSPAG
jgi:peptidoglycan/LPS O-acetylase OafA/YrhL